MLFLWVWGLGVLDIPMPNEQCTFTEDFTCPPCLLCAPLVSEQCCGCFTVCTTATFPAPCLILARAESEITPHFWPGLRSIGGMATMCTSCLPYHVHAQLHVTPALTSARTACHIVYRLVAPGRGMACVPVSAWPVASLIFLSVPWEPAPFPPR